MNAGRPWTPFLVLFSTICRVLVRSLCSYYFGISLALSTNTEPLTIQSINEASTLRVLVVGAPSGIGCARWTTFAHPSVHCYGKLTVLHNPRRHAILAKWLWVYNHSGRLRATKHTLHRTYCTDNISILSYAPQQKQLPPLVGRGAGSFAIHKTVPIRKKHTGN